MLEIRGLRKKYGLFEVLRGVDLRLEKGEIYGLVGKNGAGKTTMMNVIAGQLSRDAGEVKIGGDPDKRVAYILDIPAVYGFMTAYEYLEFIASGTKDSPERIKSRSAELLHLVGLDGVGNKRIKQFSRGMQQRFGIAAGIYADPELILLDEPCSALDPQGRYEINNIIRRLASSGKTVMLSTHILTDVEKICTKIGILAGGVIVYEGGIEGLTEKYRQNVFEFRSEDNRKLADSLSDGFVLKKEVFPAALFVTIEDEGENCKKLLLRAAKSGVRVDFFGRRQLTLEEIFLKEIGQ